MTAAELALAMRQEHPVFGNLIVSPSPRWPEVVRGCGLDFVQTLLQMPPLHPPH